MPMPTRRLGDDAKMGYIEFVGNEIEKYEDAVEKEKVADLISIVCIV
jgi:hypothetical protein